MDQPRTHPVDRDLRQAKRACGSSATTTAAAASPPLPHDTIGRAYVQAVQRQHFTPAELMALLSAAPARWLQE